MHVLNHLQTKEKEKMGLPFNTRRMEEGFGGRFWVDGGRLEKKNGSEGSGIGGRGVGGVSIGCSCISCIYVPFYSL